MYLSSEGLGLRQGVQGSNPIRHGLVIGSDCTFEEGSGLISPSVLKMTKEPASNNQTNFKKSSKSSISYNFFSLNILNMLGYMTYPDILWCSTSLLGFKCFKKLKEQLTSNAILICIAFIINTIVEIQLLENNKDI